MAQKERYELQKSNKNFIEIFDNVRDRWITEDNICELLNDYNKEIKELEAKVLTPFMKTLQEKKWEALREENQQLKQQLEIFKKFNEALQQDNLDLSYDKLDTAYEYAKEMAENWEKDYQEEIQQLREDLQAKDILVNTYMSVAGTLDNAKQLKQSQNQVAIKELEKLKDDLLENFGQSSPLANRVDLVVKINEQIENLKGE